MMPSLRLKRYQAAAAVASFLLSSAVVVEAWSVTRRAVWSTSLSGGILVASNTVAARTPPAPASSSSSSSSSVDVFQTAAYGRQEYTNSITASRDTNLSPAEAYDVIRQRIPPATSTAARAVDVGAGAGLSTAILYQEKGYRNIAAVDWSQTAWEEYVTQQPESVQFFEMDDTTFFRQLATTNDNGDNDDDSKFDCIVYNFAVNADKAVSIARQFLKQETGLLLAPCNDRVDYWYKQTYVLLNQKGQVMWQSADSVGAWSVQFQPDVTSRTCTGIWCGNFNGFR